jgi:hypothetical protein
MRFTTFLFHAEEVVAAAESGVVIEVSTVCEIILSSGALVAGGEFCSNQASSAANTRPAKSASSMPTLAFAPLEAGLYPVSFPLLVLPST